MCFLNFIADRNLPLFQAEYLLPRIGGLLGRAGLRKSIVLAVVYLGDNAGCVGSVGIVFHFEVSKSGQISLHEPLMEEE